MLIRLTLQNIAIIETLDLEFQGGLNVLTGETGSGKSLILEAIHRVFDKRTSPKDLLRHGTSRGRIEITFDLSRIHNRQQIEALLQEAGVELLPEENELVLGREFSLSSSRCRVNGCQVPLDLMARLGTLVMEIYGQHDLHDLFSTARQRDLLDNLGGDPLLKLRQEIRQTFRGLQKLKAEMNALRQQQQDQERQIDFLTFQIQEIAQAELMAPDEDEGLQKERERLTHCETLRQAVLASNYVLQGDDHGETPSVFKLLGQIQKTLSHGTALDPQLNRWYESMAEIQEQLRSIAHEFSHYESSLDSRPERMQEIVDRLDTLEKLKRKYGGSLESVLKTAVSLEAQLEALQQNDIYLTQLETQCQNEESRYTQLCLALSELRQKLAQSLEETISEELKTLMLPAAQFQIQIIPSPATENGQDQITFLFSANPGEPLKPLSQVASGGELARLMLALKIQTAHADSLTTLVLDEIDTGMSGLAVRTVAEKLCALQHHCQIIVVTHQPIVAAKAQWHLHVQKHLHQDKVEVNVHPLTHREERKTVLSQLASGFTEGDAITAQFIEQLLV